MKQLIFIALGIILLAQYSCKKVQPDMNSIDCSCAKQVSADFSMEERATIIGNDIDNYLTETDTILKFKRVKFSSKENDAEYTWYIGNEILHSKTVERFFNDTWAGQTLPITLVVKKKPNLICFPFDDGYDSITKFITVSSINLIGSIGESNFEGQYKVKSPLLPDSIIIILDYHYSQSVSSNMLNIINYDGLGSDCLDEFGYSIYLHDIKPNYKQYFIRSFVVSKGEGINGDIKLNGNKVEMNIKTGKYVNGVYNFDAFDWKYKGRKL
jgi:hypothetical protein